MGAIRAIHSIRSRDGGDPVYTYYYYYYYYYYYDHYYYDRVVWVLVPKVRLETCNGFFFYERSVETRQVLGSRLDGEPRT